MKTIHIVRPNAEPDPPESFYMVDRGKGVKSKPKTKAKVGTKSK